jgi:membrane-associated protease RseP (regulator of RpoE activity)
LDKPLNSDQISGKAPADNPTNIPVAEATPTPPPVDDADGGPPLTPLAWLKLNGFYIVFVAALIAFIVYTLGWSGLWQCFLVVMGLGFVVFIHELGHFVTAKWCDVHVQTFSLGFGPALPGCSFRYGETLYKIALFPLGGYVGMVGEGTELEGNDDDPRSFKNKSVGQRMLIISAGVIMNVLFGCLAFVLVFRLHGVERQTMDIAGTEAGGPTWQIGIRSGSRVTKIGKSVRFPFAPSTISNPFFDELKIHVSLSVAGDELAFATQKIAPDGGDFDGFIRPRSDKNDPSPVIGVAPAPQLVLMSKRGKTVRAKPVLYSSPAAAARVLNVAPGTQVIDATDDADPAKMKKVEGGWPELAQRLRKLVDKPVVLRVLPKGAPDNAQPEEIKVGTDGFQWEDVIVGMTDPEQTGEYDPFVVKELGIDQANTQLQTHDYFEYRRRLRMLTGKPIVIQVQREGAPRDSKPLNLLVPAAFHRTLGVWMAMGEVAGVRDHSPAATAGLQTGDVITHVIMTTGGWFPTPIPGGDLLVKYLDPCKIPYLLSRAAASWPGEKLVYMTVDRPNSPGASPDGQNDDKHKASKVATIGPMVWDSSWDFNNEFPSASTAALSIPQLGIAYRVESTIKKVLPNSPGDRAGLQLDDQISDLATRKTTLDPNAPAKWHDWVTLEATRGEQQRFDRWAYVDYLLQGEEFPEVQLKGRRGNDRPTFPSDKNAGILLEEDPDWAEVDRGLMLSPDRRLQKADSFLDALQYGVARTGEFILVIYQSIRSVANGRVSPDMVQGPVGIAQNAFFAAEDPYEFLLFLGLISVNLAVVNFLPIPVLDGGHMVFLIYEKLRGKPASETVQKWAMVGGLVLLGLIMAFVVYKEALMPFVRWIRH